MRLHYNNKEKKNSKKQIIHKLAEIIMHLSSDGANNYKKTGSEVCIRAIRPVLILVSAA